MTMHAPNLAGTDSSQNYDACNAPDLYQWQIALKKKTKMTALANKFQQEFNTELFLTTMVETCDNK